MSWKLTEGYFTNCHVGSFMVCQWRKAFRRHSSNHSGSFFLVEISRMMFSFKPGGADSVSTSVTKPYLYSCWTKPSIVSVAVLILFVKSVKAVKSLEKLNGSMGLLI